MASIHHPVHRAFSVPDLSEVVLDEWSQDFAVFGASPQVTARILAVAGIVSGSAALRLRVGGTLGVLDGTLAVEMVVAGAAAERSASASFSNPGGRAAVKLTAVVLSGAAAMDVSGIVERFA